ncbi:MAG: PASTA domain-containing protein [Limnochordaceae bacterium]|nr:PASTA domain-containing protein [Limnochordaceae bacterium]
MNARRHSLVTVRQRLAGLFLTLGLVALGLTLRLVQVQLVQGAYYQERAVVQRLRYVPVVPRRGDILDRRGEVLATSVSADALYAIPAQVKDPAHTAVVLAPLLGQPEEQLLEKLSNRQVGSVWLARQLPLEVARQIRQLDLPGVALIDRPQRFYPNGSLAGPVLGIVGVDNQGLEGLEVYYDRILRGKPGRVLEERDATNRQNIPGGERRYVPPQDGDTVVLTLDRVIQYVAERELAKGVLAASAERGVVVAVDPQTGEILAMANYPSFDPNHYRDFPADSRRNRAVTDQYEPGSTFKIVTGASALAEGVVRPDEEFFDPGYIVVDGDTLHCVKPGGHGTLNFVQATEVSCNVVYAQLALNRLGPQRFYQYIKAFGFGQPTGIDFPGEAGGIIHSPDQIKWGANVAWATAGFGQGVTVTPLQMVMAASAIANGGQLLRPHLVKEVRGPDGRALEEVHPEVVRRVLPESVAAEYARILRSVVVNGSGERADVPGMRVAGKTGTAQVAEGGRYTDKRIASFVGFAPVDHPRIAAIAVLYNVGAQPAYGGTWAAPIVGAIFREVLPYLGVRPQAEPPPTTSGPEGAPVPEGSSVPKAGGQGGSETLAGVAVPNVRDSLAGEANDRLLQAGLGVRFVGEGEAVMDQVPPPGAKVPPGTTVTLYLSGLSSDPETLTTVSVPDVRGQGLRQAILSLEAVGLRAQAEGSGAVAAQSPVPGTALRRGETVLLQLESTTPITEAGSR